MVAVDSLAASYLIRSRWPMTSASSASSPASRFSRCSRIATSSWQSIPSILKVDSACSSQTVQVLIAIPAERSASPLAALRSSEREVDAALLRHASRLLSSQNVLIVDGVVDEPAGAARTDQPHAAQQAQLMRDRRLADADERGDVADAQLASRSASRIRTRVGSPSTRNVSASASTVRAPISCARRVRRARCGPSQSAGLRHCGEATSSW